MPLRRGPGGAAIAALAALAGLAGCGQARIGCEGLDVDRYAVLAPATGFRFYDTETPHAAIVGDERSWLGFSRDDRRRILSAHWCKLYGATGAGRITLYESRRSDPIAAVDGTSYKTF